jgi:ABC-2 type transport system permease protein
MSILDQIYAEFIKKLRLWIRRPEFIAVGIVAPLGISTFLIILFASIASLPIWEIGLIDEDHTVQSYALKKAIVAHEGTIPYYTALTEDRYEAEQLFNEGQLNMVVIIPKGFGDKVEAGVPVQVEAMIINAHSDLTKNLRLGLTARLYNYYEDYMLPSASRPGVVYSYSLTYPTEIPRTSYMAVGALLLTVMLTSMMYAGLFSALEHEEKTSLEIEMRPWGSFSSMAGTILATLVEVLIVLAIVGIIDGFLWHLRLSGILASLQCLLAIILLAIFFSLVGYGLGNRAKDIRLVLAPTIVTTFSLWILAGGVTPIEAIAGSEVWAMLPTSAVLRILTSQIVGLDTLPVATNMVIAGTWTAATIVITLVLKIRGELRYNK